MFLKTLTLKGFKSFADATRLDLQPGVTVVVGPNGSGKSNVVDAIGWVLGAQAPSIVRSKSMDDVIFAGTSERAALGRAEVSLTIDNAAGLLPIDFTEVTISRTLFRTGDSEYAINGVPCRLLDIHEMLSDTGVGRHQHVIVGQGQIDAVLNAKPEERRAIIEEAAGILKYRRRKEKSERRLSATEANLTRLQDLLREVRRQLRPLEKQADAARRHDSVVAELRALRIHIAGRELGDLQHRLETATSESAETGRRIDELTGRLAELDTEIMKSESELSARGGDDLGDDLVRFESLRERARGLGAVLDERQRSIERDRGAFVDQGVIFTLESEAARVRDELEQVAHRQAEIESEETSLEQAAVTLFDERQAVESRVAGVDLEAAGRTAETRGEMAVLRAGIERDEGEHQRVAGRLGSLERRHEALTTEAERLRGEVARLTEGEQPLAGQLERAEHERVGAERDADDAERALRDADRERHRWAARADALALALDDAHARAGTDLLDGVEGVLGTLHDVVEVDDGWAAAFEAAADVALSAVLVADVDVGRRVVQALRSGDMTALVLVAGEVSSAIPGASGGDPVRPHVRGTSAAVDRLLDDLLAAAVRVDGSWTDALDLSMAHPGLVAVTDEGDRFGPGGWRVGGQATGVTRVAFDEAQARADEADIAQAAAEARLRAARERRDGAVRTERDLVSGIDDHDLRRTAALAALGRVDEEREGLVTEVETLGAHRDELAERIERERLRATDLTAELGRLEEADAALAAEGRAIDEERSGVEERADALEARRTELRVRLSSLAERRALLTDRLAEIDERLARDEAERERAGERRQELDERQRATGRLGLVVEARLGDIDEMLGGLRRRRQEQSDEARAASIGLDRFRTERSSSETELRELRERSEQVGVRKAEVELKIESVVETLRRDHEAEPDAAMAAPRPPLAEGVTPSGRARELEQDLRLMGPINPLALEEFDALSERHEFISGQLDDVRSSRRDLTKVMRSIDAEIVSVFSAAYADVSENFTQLFETLFPGGTGKLKLTEPDDLLNTGVEVEARPSGKNVRKLSLLSGGERSLTAMGFLFAVFRSRPSPFYVLDEVEAALDDVNLHRFLDLLAEFRADAQLVVVSHQKRTMEAADVLYGVSMQAGGSSRVLSEPAPDAVEVA